MYYYDDNFGEWDCMDPEMIRFYYQVQEESVEKTCVDCGRIVRIRSDYECCNACADRRERGGW